VVTSTGISQDLERSLDQSGPSRQYGRKREIARLADEANRASTDVHEVPRGTLRITAYPVFGYAFVAGLVSEYAARWPETRLEVVLTRRQAPGQVDKARPRRTHR